MESLRSRLQRRAALRRELPCEAVDAEAVRQFWFALSPARRLDVLRFDDPTLVQRMHNHMTGLCRAELWCQRNLVASLLHGPPGASQEPPERLRGFAFEAPAETDCIGRRPAPIAFAALSELAESDSLFEEMRKQLGSGLLEGRPALDRRDWAAVAEAAPSSWQELQRQAFRLVELAIFHAHQDAASSAAAPPAVPTGADDAAAAAAAEAAERSRSKRKAKKAKAGAAKAAARAAAAAGRRPAGPQEEEAEEEEEEEKEEEEAAEAAEGEAAAAPVEVAAGAEDADTAELGQHRPLPPPPAEEKSPRPPPEPRRESMWSAWLPNLLKGDKAEWRWVIFQPATPPGPEEDEAALEAAQLFSTPSGVKAVVKNTFLDIEHDAPVQASPARKSCYF